MDTTYPVKLTHLESIFLSDTLSMFTQGPPDALPGQASPYPNLLFKVGGAVLETEQSKSPVTVQLGLSELWIIREVAKSSTVVGNERVGLSLLFKVYEGIRALIAEFDVQSAVSAFGEVMEDEPGKGDYVVQLKQIREGSDPNPGGEDDDDEDGDDKPSNADENGPDHDAETAP